MDKRSKNTSIMSLCIWTSLMIFTLIFTIHDVSNNDFSWITFANMVLLVFDAFMWTVSYRMITEE